MKFPLARDERERHFAALVDLPDPYENEIINEGWEFQPGEGAAATAPVAAGWQSINLPHTWNAQDGQNGGGSESQSDRGYRRGTGWYQKRVVLKALAEEERLFVRFDGVSLVAEVWWNGRLLGEHRGGFNAFVFELTPHAEAGENWLLVKASNAVHRDIVPLSGDFPVFGGIYRSVRLLRRRQACFDVLGLGATGVAIDLEEVSTKRATINVTARISGVRPAVVELEGELRSAEGLSVGVQRLKVTAKPAGTETGRLTFTLEQPHLWEGREDPYLYEAVVTLRDESGEALEIQRWPVGVRSCVVDARGEMRFNGLPYRLRGVNRHQDRLDLGWALHRSHHLEDLRLIYEMGANAVRLAHYPHDDYVYALCDRLGLLVWAEVPLVDTVGVSMHPDLPDVTARQLTELIRQKRNFCCVFTWSIGNELGHRPTDDPLPVLHRLHALARAEDPFRQTSVAVNRADPELCRCADLLAINTYPGWYLDNPDDMAHELERYRIARGGGLGVSEYGAGASIHHHAERCPSPPEPGGAFHPEEWQAFVHERNYRAITQAEFCWGSFVWNMFDFASVWRNEGDAPGRNDKGLVTYDRATRKDAYFFYQANWTEQDVLHLTSRRFAVRTELRTTVKVYTNTRDVTLWVNDRAWPKTNPNEARICEWREVDLRGGANLIVVEAAGANGTAVRDSCVWFV